MNVEGFSVLESPRRASDGFLWAELAHIWSLCSSWCTSLAVLKFQNALKHRSRSVRPVTAVSLPSAGLSCVHLDSCCSSRLWLVLLCLNDGPVLCGSTCVPAQASGPPRMGGNAMMSYQIPVTSKQLEVFGSSADVMMYGDRVCVCVCVCVFTSVFLSLISSRCSAEISPAVGCSL